MKFYFPIHFDGGNRGCEGIAKGTALILGEPKENLIGLCRDVKLDNRLGIGKYVTLKPLKKLPIVWRIYNKFVSLLRLFGIKFLQYKEQDQYPSFFNDMSEDDIMVSTGGDMMCYGDNTPSITSNEFVVSKGRKSVLWGCSMGPKNLTPAKEATLKKFSLIYARESLTFEFLQSLGLKNVVCFPDPAFVLESEPVDLPEFFCGGNVIGLNLSNYTVGDYSLDTPFGKEVRKFIDYILDKTDKKILLIPHVVWGDQDDRRMSQVVVDEYSAFGDRIAVFDSDRYNYLQIRYMISNCWCFIGGRTHAVISAYSTCTPAVALGYSIKSQGIAKDLQLSDKLVIDCVKNIKPDCLVESYKYLEENYVSIKNGLDEIMPEYKNRPYSINEVLKELQLR